MSSRVGGWIAGLAIVSVSLAFPGGGFAATEDVDAVALHEPNLPGRMTVWCLGNPRHFRVAAEARGIEVGTLSNPVEFRRMKVKMSLLEWARSSTHRDVRDFDRACRIAFAAFRATDQGPPEKSETEPPECECKSGDDPGDDGNDLSAIEGAVVGAVLGGASGLGVYRRRVHRDDAEELGRLDSEFQDALARYVESGGGSNEQHARVSARLLRSGVAEWHRKGGARKDAEEACRLLDEILTGKQETDEEEMPYIGDLRGQDESAEILRRKAGQIHFHVAALARRVGWFVRIGGKRVPRVVAKPESVASEGDTGETT